MSLHPPQSPMLQAANLRARQRQQQSPTVASNKNAGNEFSFNNKEPEVKNNNKNRSLDGGSVAGFPRRGGGQREGGKEHPTKSLSPEDHRNKALKSISNCYKYALGAGILGSMSLLFDNRETLFFDRQTNRQQTLPNIPIMIVVDLCLYIHQIVFGYGLYQAFQIFDKGTTYGSRLDPGNVKKLGNILSWVWAIGASTVSIEALAMTYFLEINWIRITAILLFVVSVPICRGFHNEVAFQNHKKTPTHSDYKDGRNNGFNAALYMLFTVSALVISGLLDVVESMINTMKTDGITSKLGSVVSGVMGAAESLIVTGLLATLYHKYIKAVVVATQQQQDKVTRRSGSTFIQYFDAQASFYSRIGKFFYSQMIFTILPYVVILIKLFMGYVGLGRYVKYLDLQV